MHAHPLPSGIVLVNLQLPILLQWRLLVPSAISHAIGCRRFVLPILHSVPAVSFPLRLQFLAPNGSPLRLASNLIQHCVTLPALSGHRLVLRWCRGIFTRIIDRFHRPVAPNVILANPPYVRHHHLSCEEKERLRALTFRMTGINVHGLAGLYVYFVLLATAWMADGGYAAWLIPFRVYGR
jgi:hypothetical protein